MSLETGASEHIYRDKALIKFPYVVPFNQSIDPKVIARYLLKFTLFLYKTLKPSGIPKKSGQFWLDGRAFDVMILDKTALGESI